MICLRCNQEFDNPVPEVIFPSGIKEIACAEWCSACNAYGMSILFRDTSAYRPRRKGKHTLSKISVPKEVVDAIVSPRPRHLCACGAEAWVWNGEKSVCWNCAERDRDFEFGYYYHNNRTLPLETKYDKFGQRLEVSKQREKVIKYLKGQKNEL